MSIMESMSLRDMSFWACLASFETGMFMTFEQPTGWGIALLVAGLVGMICCAWAQIAARNWQPERLWIIGIITMFVLSLSIGAGMYHRTYSPDIQSPPSSEVEQNAPHSDMTSIKVLSESGLPLRGAEVLFIRGNGVHSAPAFTSDFGSAEVIFPSEGGTLFCALAGFHSHYEKCQTGSPITITLDRELRGGSIIIADGTGYITGLAGRLNPILDTSSRTYLYAENIAIDSGKPQPVTSALHVPMNLEDRNGYEFEVTFASIMGSSSLLDYRRLK